ncbi:MAG: uroporphyrinogen-III synthase [Kiloniellales bacterium]|nr:uroporphyrinogen-III synthase [Kiloniellales bacterium]
MRVLVTRPRPDAEAFAAALAARGHEALIEPLLEIKLAERSALPAELDAFQALLATSANGLRAFAALTERRELPVFAVGPASAEAAKAAGFSKVESAEGDVEALARLVRARLSPDDGVLLHAAGSSLAGDLKGELEAAGFTVTRAVLYTAEAAARLSDAAQAALRAGQVDAVALFSPRSAETFAALVREAGLAEACRSLRAFCLSAAVAAVLEARGWTALEVSARPETEALLALLDRPAAQGRSDAGESKDKGMAEQDGVAASGEKANGETESAAVSVIGRFGGIRPMAQKLGIAVSTVQGWRERGVIPKGRHGQIRAAAAAGGIALPDEELDAAGKRTAAASAEPSGPAKLPGPKPETPKPEAPRPEAAKPETRKSDLSKPDAPEPAEPPSDAKPAPRSSMATAAAAGRGSRSSSAPLSGGGGWLFGFLLGALVFLGGLGIAVLSRDTWLPLLGEPSGVVVAEPSPELLERLDALERALSAQEGAAGAEFAAEIGRLRAALSRVEAEVGAGASTSSEAQAALSGLEARLSSLDRRVAQLGRRTGADEALRADLDDLAARLDAIEGRLVALPQVGPDGRIALPEQVAVVLAIAQLRDALRRSAPFARELDALTRLAGGDAELAAVLDTLAPNAAAGIPTRESLRAEFPQVARAIAAAGAGAGEEGWLAGVRRRLSDLVTVRPVGGDAVGEDPGAVAARAEARVAAGDLAGALAELDGLSGRAAAAAADWRRAARARGAAEDALQLLGGRVVESLAPSLAAAQDPAPETEAETEAEAAAETEPETAPEPESETATQRGPDPAAESAGDAATDPDPQ